jgi:DNA mismatch endonuclease (patch repair protein)
MDIAFGRAKVAVFVDGCFWHVCPDHATWPRDNQLWWRQKLVRNVERDRETDAHLNAAWWDFVRESDNEPIDEAARRVQDVLRRRA